MGYNIIIGGELVGSGLSKGELKRWLMELWGELSPLDKKVFELDLGSSGDFEEYLYNTTLEFPLFARFREMILEIYEEEI
jgi:hypothetical protein